MARWRILAALAALVVLGLGYAAVRAWWPANPLREAEAALDRYDFPTAQRGLAAYLHDRPDDPAGHFLAARVARYSGDFAGAAEHLRRARRLGYPEPAIELEHLLLRASRQHDPAAVTQLQARADAGGPDAPAILEVLAQDCIATYRLRDAIAMLDRLLELRPDNVKALVGRGRVKERLFDYGAAVADYREALRFDPDQDEARRRLAGVLLINGRPQDAAAEYEQLRERQGDTPAVLLGLARCRRHEGRLPEALELLDQLLAQAPDNAAALAERGKIALELGRPAEAEPSLRRAVALTPYDREAQHNLYQCLRITGPAAEAALALARYRQLDADLRRLDKMTSGVTANPADLDRRCAAAEVFFRLGEPVEGMRWLRTVLAIAPNHAAAQQALARHSRAAEAKGPAGP